MSKYKVGSLNENSLHASLKQEYTNDGAEAEVLVDGYVIDVVRKNELVEIQTRNFSGFKKKIARLLDNHKVRVVHPIPVKKTIVMMKKNGGVKYRRKSPKTGRLEDVINELVFIPHLAKHSNFTLEVVYTDEEDIRLNDGKGSWRRRGVSLKDRALKSVTGRFVFSKPRDYLILLPKGLPNKFTNKEIAKIGKLSRNRATKLSYFLKHLGVIQVVEKNRNEQVFKVKV